MHKDAISFTLEGYDPDNERLTYITLSGPYHGYLQMISPDRGKVVYTPDIGYNGSDSFTFKANDGRVNSSSIGTVYINVKPLPYTKSIPYKFKFVYGNPSSPLPAANNISYTVHFEFKGKNINILRVNKGTFSSYNITGKIP
jgi:hypothetical protein